MKSIIKMTSVILATMLFCFCLCDRKAFALEQTQNYDEISGQIAANAEKYHIPGMAVIVVDKSEVLFCETYGNCNSMDTPFIIGSMSKSFTALAIMQLKEAGKINTDYPISEYIDASQWFKDSTDCDAITVRDLLNQTSGITTYQTFGELQRTDSYGSHIYANTNYGLLGLIVEAVSGTSYEDYMKTHIFSPLGMEHTSSSLEESRKNGLITGYRNYFGIPVAGEPDFPDEIKNGTWTNVPAGYISASISDIGKYLQMYLNGGGGIVSEDSVNSMFYDSVPVDETSSYGMGWQYSATKFNQPILWHSGLVENSTSVMYICPEQGISVAVLVNMNDFLVANEILPDIVKPLIGEKSDELPDTYIAMHLLIDAVCLFICFMSIYPIVTIRRWYKKRKTRITVIIDCLRHIAFPILLMCVPLFINTPAFVLWLFVKDLFLVLYINAGILFTVGIIKLIFRLKEAYKEKRRKA